MNDTDRPIAGKMLREDVEALGNRTTYVAVRYRVLKGASAGNCW